MPTAPKLTPQMEEQIAACLRTHGLEEEWDGGRSRPRGPLESDQAYILRNPVFPDRYVYVQSDKERELGVLKGCIWFPSVLLDAPRTWENLRAAAWLDLMRLRNPRIDLFNGQYTPLALPALRAAKLPEMEF